VDADVLVDDVMLDDDVLLDDDELLVEEELLVVVLVLVDVDDVELLVVEVEGGGLVVVIDDVLVLVDVVGEEVEVVVAAPQGWAPVSERRPLTQSTKAPTEESTRPTSSCVRQSPRLSSRWKAITSRARQRARQRTILACVSGLPLAAARAVQVSSQAACRPASTSLPGEQAPAGPGRRS